jgi:integrase
VSHNPGARKRRRLAEGIYADAYGIAAVVTVKTLRRERRFLPDEPLDRIEHWRVQTRAELDAEIEEAKATGEPTPERGTFAKDLPRYLKQITGRVSYAADRSHLRAWLPFIGSMNRRDIKPTHVARAFAAWLEAGKSPRTIRHRRRVLRELYQALDGAHARPPIRGVKLPRIPDPHPTPVPLALIRRVAKSLKAGKRHKKGYGSDSDKTYARFLVRATTGQRPSQIMRAERADVDLRRRIWFVRAGKGGTQVPLPLNADMVAAWHTFIKVEAWGPFDARSFAKTLRRHGWPKDVRPYNLRHTFAIDLLLKGADLGDVQGLLGHRQIETTRKFYGPILVARLRKVGATRHLKLA